MEINSSLQLALRIAGTKQRRAGFTPLVTVGVLAGDEGANMYRSPMVAERLAYVVKHAPGYILYLLIDRGVKPFDADANGVLSIALTISSKAQLAGGKSPYTILDEVYKKYVETYMKPTNDGRLSFLDLDNNNEIFSEIVSCYQLEERKSAYVMMAEQGLTGVVCVPQNKLSDFFVNTQYKEFAAFKDIEIGVNCLGQVSSGLEKLQIPLPPNIYEIWVNGKPMGVSMQSPTDSYLTTAESTNLYNYENVDFTLSELLNAPMNRISKNGATISLDYQKNRISCDLKKTDVLYDLVYEWSDKVGGAKEKILSFVKNGNLSLKFGTIDISKTLFGQYNIKAIDIKDKKIEFRPQVIGAYSLNVLSDIDDAKHQIVTKIIINKKAISGGQYIGQSQQSARVQLPTSPNKASDANDYFKGGEKSHTEQDLQKKEKWFNIKSFLLGIMVGVIVGLGIWLVVSELSESKNETKTTTSEEITDSFNVVEDDGNQSLYDNENGQEVTETEMESRAQAEAEPNVQTEAEKKAQAEAEAKLRAEKKAQAEAEAKLQAEKKAAAKEALADLIRLINGKDLQKCRNHEYWKSLSQQDKIAIEAVLNLDQFKDQVDPQGWYKLKEIKKRKFSFNSLSDVKEVQNEITTIIKNNKKL